MTTPCFEASFCTAETFCLGTDHTSALVSGKTLRLDLPARFFKAATSLRNRSPPNAAVLAVLIMMSGTASSSVCVCAIAGDAACNATELTNAANAIVRAWLIERLPQYQHFQA